MAEVFNWIRPGYELVRAKLEWNVQIPFLHTTDGSGSKRIHSRKFSALENPGRKWNLNLYDQETKIFVYTGQFNSAGKIVSIFEPVLVKISILNEMGRKVFQQVLPSTPDCQHVAFMHTNSIILTKEEVIASECQQADGSYTFCCKIISHVKKEPTSLADPPGLAINCSDELITQLEGLFDEMQFSDVIFNVAGREFPAHKNILAARSEVFAAMFKHPTKENLTNQIEIEDIEPEVFHGLLRFIYTGRLNSKTMETTAAGLLITADKYLLIKLKNACEKFLLRHMTPVNCVEILLHVDLLNPAEHLKKVMKEAAKFFRRLQSEVMATAKWEKMEEENPKKLFQIQKFLLSNK